MKTLITALTLLVLSMATACDSGIRNSYKIEYVKDERVGLCFAVAYRAMDGVDYKKVERFLSYTIR